VRLVDTAEFYGPGTSERLIAEALHPYPDGLVIATKGLTHPPDRWDAQGHAGRLREAVEGSLRRLRRSPVMLPIPGTSSVAHLEENLAAATLRLGDDEFQLLGSM
jgi:aryl-alcohol dehydrogenase-like predicted oxidoreductase